MDNAKRFNPARLREAMAVREVTPNSLSSETGLSLNSVYRYIRGEVTPTDKARILLAQALRMPLTFFTDQTPPPDEGFLFFRSFANSSRASRMQAEVHFQWADRVFALLQDYIDFPDFNLEGHTYGPTLDLDGDLIEAITEQLREDWGLGNSPIQNVTALLESHGIPVFHDDILSDRLEAFSAHASLSDRPVVFLSSDDRTAVRIRFSLLHELGHIVLHNGFSASDIRENHKKIEKQANRFAGAFLIPAEKFMKQAKRATLSRFLELKQRWGASIALMIHRAEDLGLITAMRARSLWQQLSRFGWRKHEPFDDTIPVERPEMIQQAIELLIGEKVIVPSDFLQLLRLGRQDVERLCGLAEGFLEGRPRLRLKEVPTQ